MKNPLISIVIPTKNSEKTLRKTLDSIKVQIYGNYEIVIVDGFSTDKTEEIAREYTDKFHTSAASLPGARNEGFARVEGQIYASIDSDMILEPMVLGEAVKRIKEAKALVVPEVGYGRDFISRCKDLEKRCYHGDEVIEAARIFTREVYDAVNGYDDGLLFGEDWDIHCRIKKETGVGRLQSKIYHNTEHLSFFSNIKKAYKYGKTLPRYIAKGHPQTKEWLDVKKIFFIRHFSKLRKEPVTAVGLFFIKCTEYAAGITGYLSAKLGV